MPRPKGHGPAYYGQREVIIDIAAKLFARKGYSETSVAELCEAAKVARGALYYYIGSKEELLLEIQARVIRPLLEEAAEIVSLPEGAAVRLRLLSESLLRSIFQRVDHIWVYEHEYRILQSARRRAFLADRQAFEEVVSSLLNDGVEAGLFEISDLKLATFQFLNLHNYTFKWINTKGRWTAQHLSSQYCATLFHGMATRRLDTDDVERRVDELRQEAASASKQPFAFSALAR